MDYAEQELLRQQKALAAVLLGRTAEKNRQAETADRETMGTAALGMDDTGTGAALPPARGGGSQRSYGRIRSETAPTAPEKVSRQRIGVTVEGGQAERTVTEFFRADVREAPDAETLSRTFQRDARRYDGGFTLY